MPSCARAPTPFDSRRDRRTLCALHKVRVLDPNDLLRTGLASARDLPLHGALPHRTQSSGPRKSTPAARPYARATSASASAPAPRWNAQLLPPRSRLNGFAPLSGQYGFALSTTHVVRTFRGFEAPRSIKQSPFAASTDVRVVTDQNRTADTRILASLGRDESRQVHKLFLIRTIKCHPLSGAG